MNLLESARRKYRSDGFVPLLIEGSSFLVERASARVRRGVLAVLGETVVDNSGVLMDFNSPVFTADMKDSIVLGQFGPRLDWVETITSNIASADADVVEIGAGSGFMSTKVNAAIAPSLTHVAVEANPSVIPALERTRALNDAGFEVYNKAYAPHVDEVEFRVYDDFKSGTSETGRGDPSDLISVPATTLSEVSEAFDLESFVLYTNMEGKEFEMLDEEFDFIVEHCPRLVISFHSFTDHDVDEYLARLDDAFEQQWDNGSGTYVYENPAFSE